MIINLISDIAICDNYALQKIKKFYSDQGNEIIEQNIMFAGLEGVKTFVSVVFKKNTKHYRDTVSHRQNVILGGSGWDMSVLLPPEIEAVQLKQNFGFTSRGCNRKCHFCIVPEKEGKFRPTGDIYDLWDGTKKAVIRLWDNNILFDQNHFGLICEQIRKNRLILDLNQGVDFRLITEESIRNMKGVRVIDKWRFALDDVASIPFFEKQLELINQVEATPFVYVYTDGTDWEGLMTRLDFLKRMKCKPYLMQDDKIKEHPDKKLYTILGEWTNNKNGLFFTMTFDEFKVANRKRKKKALFVEQSQNTFEF